MLRTLKPELLDSLPPDHPDAQRSRRDLVLINRIMGNHRWIARTLPALVRPGERVLELGAGTGELGQRLARSGVISDGLDLVPRPDTAAPSAQWHQSDLLTFPDYLRYPTIVGNLILHHFSDDQLRQLGARLRESARLVIACEPWRDRRCQLLFKALAPLFGANHVTRHDAIVSIAAGFRAGELPEALGLDDGNWDYRCHMTALGAYRMVAIRRT
jgi:2-polyprenyl-3-methyl-5-hydroxy-6-metoxy-1,4-benzoquinol methylase